MHRIFILSPASTSGKRASMLMNHHAQFDLARRLRSFEATLGEVFSFLSGLYFRGKYTYSQFFGRPPAGLPKEFVITSDAGLVVADEKVSLERLRSFAQVPIDLNEPRYTQPFHKSCQNLIRQLPSDAEVVLLGSIATNKYADILMENFGSRLLFPRDFIGRGDMSRGGLLLRSVLSGTELEYLSLGEAPSKRGSRPDKLPRLSPGYLKRLSTKPQEDQR